MCMCSLHCCFSELVYPIILGYAEMEIDWSTVVAEEEEAEEEAEEEEEEGRLVLLKEVLGTSPVSLEPSKAFSLHF